MSNLRFKTLVRIGTLYLDFSNNTSHASFHYGKGEHKIEEFEGNEYGTASFHALTFIENYLKTENANLQFVINYNVEDLSAIKSYIVVC